MERTTTLVSVVLGHSVLMNAQSPIPSAAVEDRRGLARTNLYLAASLRWGGNTIAVRVRNLSQHGALVEAGVLPPPGTPVELTRGRLGAMGVTAWTHAGRAGLRLLDAISARDWMAPVLHKGQQQVDAVIAAVRSGDRPTSWPRPVAPSPSTPADDLRLARTLLHRLSDQLADDAELVARHGPGLQLLDLVQQLLDAMSGVEQVGTARLTDLRRAASAALAD